jgi:signal peptidase I
MCWSTPNSFSPISADHVLSISGSALDLLLSDVVARGMSFRFRARGYSMYPFIRDGDVLTIVRKPAQQLQTGHVVAVRRPGTGKIVVHRIISRRSNGFRVQGDNAVVSEGLVPGDGVLGVVIRVERGDKRVMLGQGPERYLIAYLSRHHWLRPIIYRSAGIISYLRRGHKRG